MRTILVSGTSGIIGYGILKSLRQSHPECRLIGTTVYERSAAPAFCDVFEKAPMTNHASYLPWLLDVIQRHDVAMVIPGIEVDVVAWNEHRAAIEQSGAQVLLNDPDLIRLCADKWQFYQSLVKHHSPYAIPTTLEFDETSQCFPLLLKPRKGSGSKGIVVVNDIDELRQHLGATAQGMMIQPVIGSEEEEYTTSAFFDRDSRLCAFHTLRRTLSDAGFTETAETVELEGVQDALLHFGQIFTPVGPTNFQFRLDGGKLKLLEINPRISSSTSLRAAFGYNESAMSVEWLLDGKLPGQPALKQGYAVRYTEDLVFYDRTHL